MSCKIIENDGIKGNNGSDGKLEREESMEKIIRENYMT